VSHRDRESENPIHILLGCLEARKREDNDVDEVGDNLEVVEVYVYVYMYVYMYVYVFMYVCMCMVVRFVQTHIFKA